MTDWFARPVLHVTDVEASLLFYVNLLSFTSPWRYDDDGRAHVAQVDRQGCALILADTWPEKIGKGLMFISLNLEPQAQVAALDALRAELEAAGAASLVSGRPAVLHGSRSSVLADEDGQVLDAESISAGDAASPASVGLTTSAGGAWTTISTSSGVSSERT